MNPWIIMLISGAVLAVVLVIVLYVAGLAADVEDQKDIWE